MSDPGKKKFRRIAVIYWCLLIYIIAALIWWFISLQKQNVEMADFSKKQLIATVDSLATPEMYQAELERIDTNLKRNTTKYVGEGSIFLLLILFGAAFVYRSVRKQFRMQQQQQNFMMAVTHELKTPISVARLNLETLQKYSLEPEKQKKLIHMTLEETSRLNTLINNILISSQLEAGGLNPDKEDLDLSNLFKDCIRDFRNRYPERNFNEEIEPDTDITGDALLLQMLINNLLENAVKYSPKEKPITGILKKNNGSIILSVIDEGPGIPDEEKKKIFQRFYRMGNELTRKAQGTGLGLYLSRIIAKDHNATISVSGHLPNGSNFTVTFNT
jgi:signal transduction histidine kinase